MEWTESPTSLLRRALLLSVKTPGTGRGVPLEKYPVNAHPPSPVLWPKKEKTRAQSVDPAAPNSFRYGRSAVSISSLANGAFGEHRRHDTDG